ncbi:hypothetical protein FB451DRAFT_1415186 [Mycena latifolia]|nr:hypothetical protein FB451DRAFT_1415186 [Mycena latifolia]
MRIMWNLLSESVATRPNQVPTLQTGGNFHDSVATHLNQLAESESESVAVNTSPQQKVSSCSLLRIRLPAPRVDPSPIHHPPRCAPCFPPPSPRIPWCPPCLVSLHPLFSALRALPATSRRSALAAPPSPPRLDILPSLSILAPCPRPHSTLHVLLPRVQYSLAAANYPAARGMRLLYAWRRMLAAILSPSCAGDLVFVPTSRPRRSFALSPPRVPPAKRRRTAFSAAAGMRALLLVGGQMRRALSFSEWGGYRRVRADAPPSERSFASELPPGVNGCAVPRTGYSRTGDDVYTALRPSAGILFLRMWAREDQAALSALVDVRGSGGSLVLSARRMVIVDAARFDLA